MSYEDVCKAVIAVGEELAKEYGYTSRQVKESDFWADHGSCVLTWGDKEAKKYIEFRYRFKNPVLTIYDGNDMGNVEIGRAYRITGAKDEYGYDVIEYDNVYRPKEFMAFGAGGIKLMLMLKKRIEKVTRRATNKFYEK